MAGFLSYGGAKALSYEHDFDKDIDRLYQREAYRTQVEAEKERKASELAAMMKEQPAATPYNQARLSEFYEGKAKEVADFNLKHPNWRTDVMLSQKMYSIMDGYLNNDIVREDQEVQKQWTKTQEALNSGNIKESEYLELAKKYEDYKVNGGDPYVFFNPKRQSSFEIIKEVNTWLEPEDNTYTDKSTGAITRVKKVSDEKIRLGAIAVLSDDDKKFVMEQEFNKIDEETRNSMYNSLFDYVEQRIRVGEEGSRHHIGYDDMIKFINQEAIKAETQQRGIPMYHQTNVQLPLSRGQSVMAHPANLAFTEWNNPGGQINTSGQGRTFKTYDANGEITNINLKGTLTALDGGGEIFTIGGIPYEKVPVAYSFTPTLKSEFEEKPDDSIIEKMSKKQKRKEAEKQQEADMMAMSKKLEELGWTNYGSTTPGISDAIKGEKTTASIFHGSVIVPVDMSEASRMSYDKAFGLTGENMMKNAQAYNNDMALFNAAERNDIPTVSSLINQQYGKTAIKSKAAEMGKDLDGLAWEPFGDDMMKYRAILREDGKEVKHLIFDLNTNKVIDLDPR